MRLSDLTSRVLGAFWLVLAMLLSQIPNLAQAEKFVISFKDLSGTPIEGAQIFGNQGFNTLPGRYSDSKGNFLFDTDDITGANPTLAFSLISKSYNFSPQGLNVNRATCPNNVCKISGVINPSHTSAIVHWTFTDNNAQPIKGLPVALAGYDDACPQTTDGDGYVLFQVTKATAACTDQNGFNLSVMPENIASNKACTFTNKLTRKLLACTDKGDFWGYSTVNCQTIASKFPVKNVSTFTVEVLNPSSLKGVAGVGFFGDEPFNKISTLKRQTDSTGKMTFSSLDAGRSANSVFNIIPYGKYEFYPKSLSISQDSCPGNICRIWALKTNTEQGVASVAVKDGDWGMPGVTIDAPSLEYCDSRTNRITDDYGKVAFPVRVTSGVCNNDDDNLYNDLISFNPSSPGCGGDDFTDNSGSPFQICPSSSISTATYRAYCDGSKPGQVTISGRVYGIDGLPVINQKILNGSSQGAFTNQNGEYSLVVDIGSTPVLTVDAKEVLYDPAMISFNSISAAKKGINFRLTAPDSEEGPNPLPTPPCAVKESNTISGVVYNDDSSRLEGVQIYNNGTQVATTDNQGNYSFTIEPNTSQWIQAKLGDSSFDPGGDARLFTICDLTEVNFRKTEVLSYIHSGQVKDRYGNKLKETKIIYLINGIERTTSTDEDGEYIFTLPEGASYTIFAQRADYTFNPTDYTGISEENKFNLDFVSDEGTLPATPTPTPTPVVTPTPTPNPTPVPTATPKVTPTPTPVVTPTPSPTPVVTPTFTPTPTPSPAPTATPKQSPTPTVTPTSTPSPTPTATLVPAPTPKITPTPTDTPDDGKKVTLCHVTGSINNPSNTITVSANAVAPHLAHGDYLGECKSDTPTPTPSIEPQPTPTVIPEPSPTFSPTPEPTPEVTPDPLPELGNIDIINGYSSGRGLDAVMYNNLLYFSHYSILPTSDLLFTYPTSKNSWSTEVVEKNVHSYTDTTELETAIAFDFSNKPNILYFQPTKGELRHATRESDGWVIETIDNNGNGGYPSLTADSNGMLHTCYRDTKNGDLKYAKMNTDRTWSIELVASEGDVGIFCEIKINNSNIPYIAYFNNSQKNLQVAIKQNSGWKIEDVLLPDSQTGYHPDLVFDNNGRAVIHHGYAKQSEGYPDYYLYRSTQQSDGSWNTVGLASNYEGGWPAARFDNNGFWDLTYRRYMASALFGKDTSVSVSRGAGDKVSHKTYLERANWCLPYYSHMNIFRDSSNDLFVVLHKSDSCDKNNMFEGIVVWKSGELPPKPTPTPVETPTSTPVPVPSVTPEPTLYPTPTPTPEITPTPTPTIEPSPVPTVSPSPIPSATPTPIQTPSPTPTPDLKIRLTAMCSDAPERGLRWRVRNPFDTVINVTWDVYGTSQRGALSVAALADSYFYTIKVENSPNTTRLFNNGVQVDVKAANFNTCLPTPSPTPTPTPTPIVEPEPQPTPTQYPTDPEPSPSLEPEPQPTATPYPSASPTPEPTPIYTPTPIVPPPAPPTPIPTLEPTPEPTNYPTPIPTATPEVPPTPEPTPVVTPTAAPTPTPVPTATPTPIPMYDISGFLKNRNGDEILESGPLGQRLKRALATGEIEVKLQGNKMSMNGVIRAEDFRWIAQQVPKGKYKISFGSYNNVFEVVSRPKIYNENINKTTRGVHFSIRVKQSPKISSLNKTRGDN